MKYEKPLMDIIMFDEKVIATTLASGDENDDPTLDFGNDFQTTP